MKQKQSVIIFTVWMSLMGILNAQGTTPLPPTDDGKVKFLLSGFGFTNYEAEEHGNASFSSGFSPIFLWKLNNRILFESEAEFEFEDGGTEVGLEYAQVLYVLHDNITIGAGKFLSPNNNFMERVHPSWINKLPSMPFGVSGHGGVPLLASTQLGVQARGAFGMGAGKLTYSVYASNGPILNVEEEDGHEGEPLGPLNALDSDDEGDGHGTTANGTLNFSNTSDNNDNKALGGRVAVIPFPQLEIGYGFETAKVGAGETHFSDVKSFNNVFDLTYVRDVSFLKGRIDIRGQYIMLKVDNPDEHPLEFENESSAGYGQFAYQPYHVKNDFIKNIELVGRYDFLDLPAAAPLNIDQKRITLGFNYWLSPSTVVKFSIESITSEHEDEKETESKFIAQFAIGL